MLEWDPARGRNPKPDPADPADSSGARSPGPFTLYVEGPRDRSILRGWAYRLLPVQASRLFASAVILGGRRPARALQHFRAAGLAAAGGRGLCILDRDSGDAPPFDGEAGLELFTWSRRHIESYLLVPGAIRRVLGLPDGDRRVERALGEHLPGDEAAWRELDAKRLVGPKGALARALGRPLPLAHVARATREDELHADVHAVFARLRRALGVDQGLAQRAFGPVSRIS